MKTCRYGNKYFLMKRLDGNLNKLLHSDEKINLKNILFQLLAGVYILNHKIKLYHNDLFDRKEKYTIKNVMYIKNKNEDIVYENNFMKFKIGEYLIKIIDFGQSDKEPRLKVSYVKEKLFEELKLTSEVLFTMYSYFKTLYLKNNVNYYHYSELEIKTLNLGKRLEKKSNYNLKIFDQLVIKYIKNNFNNYLNLVV